MRNNGQVQREILIIGPQDSQRVAALSAAARQIGVNVVVHTYLDVINGKSPPIRPGTLVRLESPGGCTETTRAILREGIAPLEDCGGSPVSIREIDLLACERGEIMFPRQWYLGLQRVLQDIATRVEELKGRWMSTPHRVITAFDKADCLKRWSEAGLPIPRQYQAAGSFAELRRAISRKHARLIIKLRYGYSAIGAVALEWRNERLRAITTVETVWAHGRSRLFVSKRPRQLLREIEIEWLIDTLAAEQIIVEDWLPKARWNNRPYDVRIVTIAGEMRHLVGRSRASPFTNLNLDAKRIPAHIIQEQLGDAWEELGELARRADAGLPDSGPLGLDVVVGPNCKQFTLLEANAFGDYLPGLLHREQSTYEAELNHEGLNGSRSDEQRKPDEIV